jgi:hypothetical protein
MNAVRLTTLFLASALTAAAADVPAVIQPTTRQTAVDRAKQLLATKDATPPAALKDPFYSETFANVAAGVVTPGAPALDNNPSAGAAAGGARPATPGVTRPAGPRTNRDLVEAIANGVKPSGYLVLRGEPVLLFGQKRVKAGDALTLTFEGTEYTVVVTSIKAPNFSIRLNNDEFTRPIR